MFSVVYAWAQACHRHETWQEFTEIANSISLPWLVIGDFHTILDPAEKKEFPYLKLKPSGPARINVYFTILATKVIPILGLTKGKVVQQYLSVLT